MNMTETEKLYQQALLYRNNKVDDCNEAESQIQAEILFLKVIELGHHPHALHNYGSIQYKKGNYELAYEYFMKAGLEPSYKNCSVMWSKGLIAKKDVSVILNTNRESSKHFGHSILFDTLHGNDLDENFLKAYQGHALTCNNFRCLVPNVLHHICDIYTFNFAEMYNIKAALIFCVRSSVEPYHSSKCGEDKDKDHDNQMWKNMNINNIGRVVENVAKAMSAGAVMEIEWDTLISLCSETKSVPNNPFIGVYELGATATSLCFLHIENSTESFDCEFRKGANMKLVEQIREQILFYETKGLGSYLDLVERIYLELAVFIKLLNEGLKVHLECDMESDPTAKILKALRKPTYHEFPGKDDPRNLIAIHDTETNSVTEPGHIYGLEDFMRHAYSNVILSSIAAENNTPEIVRYMKSAGFKDVTAERRTNEHNGRQNVWMVRAVKV